MNRLMTQLLDFANARLGTLPVRPQAANLKELCDTAVAEFKEHSAQFVMRTAGDVTGTWDPDRVLQLLSNLLGNAVQHGQTGEPITLTVDAERLDVVELAIGNAGTLPGEVARNLFTPFVRSDDPSGGTGLGLFIVDQIVRGHGGHVSAESKGGWTTFTVQLPRHSTSHGGERPPR
jgi:signal transduction histidine kinase